MKKEDVIPFVHTKMEKGLIEPRNLIKEMTQRGYYTFAITDENTVQSFPTVYKSVTEYNKNNKEHVKVLYGSELKVINNNEPFKVTVIVRNREGLQHLYELMSLSHTKYRKGMPLEIIGNLSKGLLIGSTGLEGEIERFIDKSEEELSDMMFFYDFIEVNDILEEEKIKKIIKIASQNRKLIVATRNIYYLEEKDNIYLDVLSKGRECDIKQSLLSTEELLTKFSFLGEEVCYKIVVSNLNKIKNLCEDIIILPEEIVIPEIPNGDIKLTMKVFQKAHLLYGNKLPKEVIDRIAVELYGTPILKLENLEQIMLLGRKKVIEKIPECNGNGILGASHEAMFLIPKMLVDISFQKRYKIESRGTVGSSFIAYLLELTEVNPLFLHVRCPKCGYTVFKEKFEIGKRICPNCHEIMKQEGYNIPYASLLGSDASLLPDIDINVSDVILEDIKKEAKRLFGKENVFSPGVIGVTNCLEVELLVKRFYDKKIFTKEQELEILKKGIGIKNRMGIYPGAFIILPKNRKITEFTPIEKCIDSMITHFDYHDLQEILPKFDVLGHTDLTLLKEIEKNSKIDIMNIPFDDKNVFELLESAKPLNIKGEIVGTLGIAEFSWEGMKELRKLNIFPKNFLECTKILGLSHGTGTWEDNALELLKQGIPLSEVISHRDDIMNKLLEYSFSYKEAYEIMEFIGKGKQKKNLKLWNYYKKRMQNAKIEDWYIDSCEKIIYLFPKAHHTSYMINIYRFMYAKIYEPIAFYKGYFKIYPNGLEKWRNKSNEEIKKTIENQKELSTEEKIILEVLVRNIDMKDIIS